VHSIKYEICFFLGTCAQANSRRKRRYVEDENLMISPVQHDSCESCDEGGKSVQKRQIKVEVETEEEVLRRSYGSQLR
jgi:hypothetical protein